MKLKITSVMLCVAACLSLRYLSFAAATYDSTSVDGCLIVTVDADGATMDAAQVTAGITNIVKRGPGELTASSLTDYEGDFSLEEGVYGIAVAAPFGKTSFVSTVDVRDGATVAYRGSSSSSLKGKTLNLYGDPAEGQNGKIVALDGARTIPYSVGCVRLVDGDATFFSGSGARLDFSGVVDLCGHELLMKGNQIGIVGVVTNGGAIAVSGGMFIAESAITFAADSAATGRVILRSGGQLNLKNDQTMNGWTLIAEDGSHIRGNANLWPTTTDKPQWSGPVQLSGTVGIASYPGGSSVSNTVYNIHGPLSGSDLLKVGPGWLNLHDASNTYTGRVIVTGKSPSSVAQKDRVLAGGGGIGVWNGAACFPQATSVTLTNSARFALMDDVKAALPVLTFADSTDDQSFVGGTFANGQRSVSAGITKTSASTLLLDSPVAVTGAVRVTAGTLKVAQRAVSGNAGLREWHLASTASAYNDDIAASMKPWEKETSERVTVTDNGDVSEGPRKILTKLEAPALDSDNKRTRHGYWYTGYLWNRSPTNETWQILADYSNPNVSVYVGDDHTKLDISQNAAKTPLKPAELDLPPGSTRIDLWMFTWATGGDTKPAKFNKLGLSYARYPVVAPADFTGTDEQLAPFVQMTDGGTGALFTVYDRLPEEMEGSYEPLPVVEMLEMAVGTTLDLSDNYCFRVGTLVGLPTVTNAPYLAVTNCWTLKAADTADAKLTTDGRLAFAVGATLMMDDARAFPRPVKTGRVIAHAAGGITGVPTPSRGWTVRPSDDGKDLLLFWKPLRGMGLIYK